MRSEGLELQRVSLRPARDEGGRESADEWVAVEGTGSLVLFTVLFEERRRSGVDDREQEVGSFMERQEPRMSAPHQIQRFSVLDRNEREDMGGRERRGREEHDTDGGRLEKTSGRARP